MRPVENTSISPRVGQIYKTNEDQDHLSRNCEIKIIRIHGEFIDYVYMSGYLSRFASHREEDGRFTRPINNFLSCTTLIEQEIKT